MGCWVCTVWVCRGAGLGSGRQAGCQQCVQYLLPAGKATGRVVCVVAGSVTSKAAAALEPVVAVCGAEAWRVSHRLCGAAGFFSAVDMSVHMSGVPLHGLHVAAGAAVTQPLM